MSTNAGRIKKARNGWAVYVATKKLRTCKTKQQAQDRLKKYRKKGY